MTNREVKFISVLESIDSTWGQPSRADRNGIFTWARRQYLRSLSAKGEVQTQVRRCRSDREVKKGV